MNKLDLAILLVIGLTLAFMTGYNVGLRDGRKQGMEKSALIAGEGR